MPTQQIESLTFMPCFRANQCFPQEWLLQDFQLAMKNKINYLGTKAYAISHAMCGILLYWLLLTWTQILFLCVICICLVFPHFFNTGHSAGNSGKLKFLILSGEFQGAQWKPHAAKTKQTLCFGHLRNTVCIT